MLFEKIALEPDEEVLIIVRKHWLVISLELLTVFITAILPLILLSVANAYLEAMVAHSIAFEVSSTVVTFGISTWLLLCTLSGFMVWTHYYLDLWVITDRRIIAVEQVQFFNRNVAIFRLERLQDIEFSIKGLIPTFFNYGTLSAQTAGHAEANFTSNYMPNPDELQAAIQKAMDARLTELNNKPNLTGE